MFLRNKQSKLQQLFNVAVLSAVIKSGDSGRCLIKVEPPKYRSTRTKGELS